MTDPRLLHEIRHAKFLKSRGPVKVWNWATPVGHRRFERRVRLLRSCLTQPMKILEVGCGTGRLTREIAKMDVTITALDISPDLLDIAQKTIQEKNITFQRGNAYQLTFREESFDAVIGISILHHLEVFPALKEFFRVLVPGGKVCFTEPNMLNPQIFLQKNIPVFKKMAGDSPDETAFWKKTLARQLESCGYEDIRITPFDFLHPWTPERWIDWIEKTVERFEHIPVIRDIAGSLFIRAQKPHATRITN